MTLWFSRYLEIQVLVLFQVQILLLYPTLVQLVNNKDALAIPTYSNFESEAKKRIDKEFETCATQQTLSAEVIAQARNNFVRYVLDAGTPDKFETRLARGPFVDP